MADLLSGAFPTQPQPRSAAAQLATCERGAVVTEYVVITVLVSVGASLAIAACGALLLDRFVYQQAVLMFPVP